MGLVQRMVFFFVSRDRARAMEAESREWMVKCTECSREVSIWDLGGIRYGASGNPRQRARCRGCGAVTWHDTYRKRES